MPGERALRGTFDVQDGAIVGELTSGRCLLVQSWTETVTETRWCKPNRGLGAASLAAGAGLVFAVNVVEPPEDSRTYTCNQGCKPKDPGPDVDYVDVTLGMTGAALIAVGGILVLGESIRSRRVGASIPKSEVEAVPCVHALALRGTRLKVTLPSGEAVSGTVDSEGRVSMPLPESLSIQQGVDLPVVVARPAPHARQVKPGDVVGVVHVEATPETPSSSAPP